jgi:hypothetical protein
MTIGASTHYLFSKNFPQSDSVAVHLQGLGNENDYLEPTHLQLKTNMKALQISCGFNHSGAILEEI